MLETFDPYYYVLSPCHPDGPLILFDDYLKDLKEYFKQEPFFKNGFLQDIIDGKWTLIVVDPFDRTYNPAK
jgi:hypothetical protein